MRHFLKLSMLLGSVHEFHQFATAWRDFIAFFEILHAVADVAIYFAIEVNHDIRAFRELICAGSLDYELCRMMFCSYKFANRGQLARHPAAIYQ